MGDLVVKFNIHLAGLRLTTNTRIAYRYQVRSFVSWLSKRSKDLMTCPIGSEQARDSAVSEYKQFLEEAGAKVNTIKSALTAINAFYDFLITSKALAVGHVPLTGLQAGNRGAVSKLDSQGG